MGRPCVECGLCPGPCLSLTPTSSFTFSGGLCFLPPFKAPELSPQELLCLFLEFAQEVTPAFLFRFLLRHQSFPLRLRNRGFRARTAGLLTDKEAGRCRPGLTSGPGLPAPCSCVCLLVS